MNAKLSKIYYSPRGYWEGLAAVKKLALAKLALANLPAPRDISRPKFDVSLPNAVHQADLFFCLMTNSRMEERFTIRFDSC